MGYHVTILRTRQGRPVAIELAAILAAARAMPGVEVVASGQQFVLRKDGGEQLTLFWQDGEAWTSNPDEAALAVMLELAERLDARVRGDEFETYRTPQDSYFHPDDRKAFAQAHAEVDAMIRRTRLRSYVLNAAIIAIFILLGLIVHACSGE